MGSISTRSKIFNLIILFSLVTRETVALTSAIQHAMPLEFSGNKELECLNIELPNSLIEIIFF